MFMSTQRRSTMRASGAGSAFGLGSGTVWGGAKREEELGTEYDKEWTEERKKVKKAQFVCCILSSLTYLLLCLCPCLCLRPLGPAARCSSWCAGAFAPPPDCRMKRGMPASTGQKMVLDHDRNRFIRRQNHSCKSVCEDEWKWKCKCKNEYEHVEMQECQMRRRKRETISSSEDTTHHPFLRSVKVYVIENTNCFRWAYDFRLQIN